MAIFVDLLFITSAKGVNVFTFDGLFVCRLLKITQCCGPTEMN